LWKTESSVGNTVLNKACSLLRWRLKRLIINLIHLTYIWESMLSQALQRQAVKKLKNTPKTPFNFPFFVLLKHLGATQF